MGSLDHGYTAGDVITLPIPLWQRALLGHALSVCCAAWMYAVVRPRRVGSTVRVALTVPALALYLAATPFLIDRTATTILITPVTGMFSLMAFKAAAYSLGRGPLLLMDNESFLKYAAVLSMPVIPRQVFVLSAGRTHTESQSPVDGWDFLRLYAAKATGATIAAIITQLPYVPILVCHWFYALCLSLFLGALWDFWCWVALVVCGVEVAPSFDKPWLSTSFADYWSRRWNLTVTYMLRVLVYEPVMQGSLTAPSPPAMAATAPTQDNLPAVPPSAASSPAVTAAGSSADAEDTTSTSSSCSTSSQVLASTAAPQLPASQGSSRASTPAATLTGIAPAPEGTESDSDQGPLVSSTNGLRHRRGGGTARSPQQHPQLQQVAEVQQGVGDAVPKQQVKPSAGSLAQPARGQPVEAAAAHLHRKKKSLLRRYLALQASFAFSGAWHALIFYYNTGLWTWHWFTFFSVQAPIVTAESLLIKAAMRRGWQLPRMASILLTNFLLIVVANPLFFGPCDWSGMCSNMMSTLRQSS